MPWDSIVFVLGFLLDLFPAQAAESVSSPCNVSDLSMPCKVTWMWNGLWMFFLLIDMAFYGGFTIFWVVSRFCMLAILYISVIGGLLKCTVNLCVSFGTC